MKLYILYVIYRTVCENYVLDLNFEYISKIKTYWDEELLTTHTYSVAHTLLNTLPLILAGIYNLVNLLKLIIVHYFRYIEKKKLEKVWKKLNK